MSCLMWFELTLSEFVLIWLEMEQIRECRKRRKIRLIEGNAKFCHLKKFTCKGTLRHVLSVWGPEPPPPPLYTIYVCTVYLFTQGSGDRGTWTVEPKRRGEGQHNSSQSCKGSRIPTVWLSLQSTNSYKHMPQSPFTGQFFRWRHLALMSIWSKDTGEQHTGMM